MKAIASGLLALGLLAVQISEADAVACAAGRYHAGCVGPRGAVRWPSAIRLPRRRRGAPRLWCALLLARRRARLPLNGGRASRDAGSGVVRDRRARAIYFAVFSALTTAALLMASFLVALTASTVLAWSPWVRRVPGAVDCVAGRVDPRDSRLHGEHASRMIATSPVSIFRAAIGNSAFCAGYGRRALDGSSADA